jgi:hypothetical protein
MKVEGGGRGETAMSKMRAVACVVAVVVECYSTAFFLMVSSVVSLAVETTVPAILANPGQFNGKTVTVRGIATAVKPTVSHRGNPYTTLRLQDGGSAIAVYTQGHAATANGDRVEVIGVFQTVKHVGPYTFYNEIEAQSITPTPR